MDLSHEDKLRLNVLLAQSLQAIRIDESRMELYALSDKGEAKITLHANCKDEKYLKIVRQWLSTNVLGSPGGYPVFLRRWTRMGQARNDSLEKLLLLGEPEAVVAVVHANGLTNEIARRAWWCEPNSDNARCLLESKEVAQGAMGKELATFLVEFLPFEESSRALMKSVRLILQPNLIDEKTKLDIWKRGKRRNTFYVGFIKQCPESLPIETTAHSLEKYFNTADSSNVYIQKLASLLSAQGQATLEAIITVLKKPNDQDVAVEIFNTIGEYFCLDSQQKFRWRDINELEVYAEKIFNNSSDVLNSILNLHADAKAHLYAVIYLSMVSESLLDPVFGVTDAIGSVMRKRIVHLTDPILYQLNILKES
ncbi:MAG: hypothetical protein R8G33_11310 [Gammaproteobacteria bacterium]|nr:hypothetical protein [Gammaproteobacteria bacterium]